MTTKYYFDLKLSGSNNIISDIDLLEKLFEAGYENVVFHQIGETTLARITTENPFYRREVLSTVNWIENVLDLKVTKIIRSIDHGNEE